MTMRRWKKYSFILFLLPAVLPVFSYAVGEWINKPNFMAFFTPLFVFIIIPIVDYLIGKDQYNSSQEEEKALLQDHFYRYLPLFSVPIMTALIYWAGYVFSHHPGYNLLGYIGWLLSMGIAGGVCCINVAHELVHKTKRYQKWAGGYLLSLVCYAGFKVEHIRGHHVNVSTPEDISSADYNQSIYDFVPKAIAHNFRNAWRLEAIRLKRKKTSPWSWRNELIWWYSLSILFALSFLLLWGLMGLLFFIGQAVVSFTLLEIINYVEHYGLRRKKLPTGRYEHPKPIHSWNSDYFLTNAVLLNLQRHSDHHARPRRQYQILDSVQHAPQLPAGYATMVMLALIPPLWKKLINPRIDSLL